MKRILFMHQTSFIGGGSYCMLNILNTIDRKIICPVVALASEGPLRAEIEKLCIEVIIFREMATIPYNHSLLRYRSIKAYFKVHKSITPLKQLIIENHIDVVYLNNMMLCYYLQPAKNCGCNTIIHVREHWPSNEHRIQLALVRKCVYDYADNVVAINNYSASIFHKAASKTIKVYDWIDFKDRYQYMPYDEIFGEDCSNLKVFLYTGGIQRIKGADIVLDTFVNYMKDPDYRLLLVGIDPKKNTSGINGKIKVILSKVGIRSYEYIIKDYIKEDHRIKCIPATHKLKHLFLQAYCNISYFTIPHANLALAESIFLKTVSIAAETPESLEYSINGELAILAKFGNKADFISKVKNIEHSYSTIKNQLAEKSSIINQMFDKEVNSNRLAEVFQRVVSK
jgi:glycosyltransferase involved in cell wall biosynthesis